jgi:deoxyguanosine kinase
LTDDQQSSIQNIKTQQFGGEIRYIAIEGVIGVGKTSLASMLGDYFGARVVLERFEENPFLERFYEEPEHYAFQTQMAFLLSRYKQQQELFQADLFHNILITDYIFEKDKIFAYLNLQDDELKLYETIVAAIEKNILTPDLVIYLQSSTERLLDNIKKRGRPYEKYITAEYLTDLNEAYNYFFFRYRQAPLLIVNSTEIDFVNKPEDFSELLKEITRQNRSPVEYYNPLKKGTKKEIK